MWLSEQRAALFANKQMGSLSERAKAKERRSGTINSYGNQQVIRPNASIVLAAQRAKPPRDAIDKIRRNLNFEGHPEF